MPSTSCCVRRCWYRSTRLALTSVPSFSEAHDLQEELTKLQRKTARDPSGFRVFKVQGSKVLYRGFRVQGRGAFIGAHGTHWVSMAQTHRAKATILQFSMNAAASDEKFQICLDNLQRSSLINPKAPGTSYNRVLEPPGPYIVSTWEVRVRQTRATARKQIHAEEQRQSQNPSSSKGTAL